jgi:predicted N-acetyltransferase YhbS
VKSRTTAFAQAAPFFEHHFSAPHWSLENLGVLPAAQCMGFGRRLVDWGLRRAHDDGVAAAVVCSAGTEGFYKTCGFKVDVGSVTAGEGNPLASVEGGRILFAFP